MKFEEVRNYKPILSHCYAADRELVEKWHQIAGSGLNACIDREFADLKAANINFFKVSDEKKFVGYFGKEVFAGKEFLTGFFIMPELRTERIKDNFWRLAKSNFKSPFLCGLFEKNIPANRFVSARGGIPILKSILTDGTAVLYKVV